MIGVSESALLLCCALFFVGILSTLHFIFAIPVPVLLGIAVIGTVYASHEILRHRLGKND